LEKDMKDKETFLALVISNALICYQLSGTWEKYWEEFGNYFSDKNFSYDKILEELARFIRQSKNNKRFVEAKVLRLEKVKPFLLKFKWKSKFYYDNMSVLRDDLSSIMNQKKDAKTIVFAVKMFYYWAKKVFWDNNFPKDIFIPIDSRLTSLFEKYKEDYTDISKFYLDLSEKLDMPLLHLDAILWVNFDELKW
jgi:DNA-(apurinic or apyrimidinic site) lyase